MRMLRSLAMVLCGIAWVAVPAAYGQIEGEIRANVPFNFYVQETKLPAGNYMLRMMEDSDLEVMEIQSEDGKVAVTFPVEASQAKHTPEKTELYFHRYGNNEYLSRIYEAGTSEGSKVILTRSELKLQKHGIKSEEHSVTGEKRARQM